MLYQEAERKTVPRRPGISTARCRRRRASGRAAIMVHIVTAIGTVKPADRRAHPARAFCPDGFTLARSERLLFS
jgi:hypothetical protein